RAEDAGEVQNCPARAWGPKEAGEKPDGLVSSALQLFFQIVHDLADIRVNFHPIFDQSASVQHGAVVASTKGLADGVEGAFGELPREEHRDLARERNVFGSALAGHVGQADVEMLG